MNLIAQQNSLVIDVTYNCNATCHYCQWGNNKTPGRVNQADEYIYISNEILNHLGTERIVFSGGEPLLRKDLENIIAYYKQTNVVSIVTITNGFLLTKHRIESLINAANKQRALRVTIVLLWLVDPRSSVSISFSISLRLI